MMRKHYRLLLPAIMLLSATLLGSPIAASDRNAEAEREAAMTVSVTEDLFEDPSSPSNAPIIAPVTTAPDAPIIEGQETTKAPTTTKVPTTVATNANGNKPASDDNNLLSSIGEFFSGLGSSISGGFTSLGDLITGGFDSMWDKLVGSITTAIYPLNGQQGMVDILKDGGTAYVSNSLNHSIDVIYDIFAPFGVAIMLLCFCFSIAKGCFTTDLSAKNSILQPVLGMIIALAAFALAEDIMSALFTIAMNLTATVVDKAFSQDLQNRITQTILGGQGPFDQLGYAVLNGILELILMVNIAKIALMQAIAPLFIGFASGQGTRRFTLNLIKEYAKCCLVPPVTAAYAILTFSISTSTWGVFASIVIGFSIFSMASKQLDKLLN